MPSSPWMNLHETAAYTGRHYKTVLTAAQDGQLKAHQATPRGRWRVHTEDADRWIRGEAPARSVRRRAAVKS